MQAYFAQMQSEILGLLSARAERFVTLTGYTQVNDYQAMDEDQRGDMLMFTITRDEETMLSKLTEVFDEPADVVYCLPPTAFNAFMLQYLSRAPLADVNSEPVPFNSALDYRTVGLVFELTRLQNSPNQRAARRIFERQILHWVSGRPALRHFALRPRCEFQAGISIIETLLEHIH
jgi:hypothetical protein